MDRALEDELLLHIAAGTDLPTAFAALPRSEPPVGQVQRTWTGIAWAILIGVAAVLWLLIG